MFTTEAYWAFDLPVNYYYLLLVFSGTLLIYSLHRIIGINKLSEVKDSGRFKVIREYKSHIQFYILLSVIALTWAVWNLGMDTLWKLAGAGVISMAYVLPFFGSGRRLRDFNYIKIILIAAVWAYISILPLLGEINYTLLSLTALERFLFIFAITLPFDIRDLGIDSSSRLITIPKMIGVKNTYWLCIGLLTIGLIALAIVANIPPGECYDSSSKIILISYLCTLDIVMKTKGKESDLYFSGLLDGALILRGIIMWIFILIL